jgi:hypothetical protein
LLNLRLQGIRDEKIRQARSAKSRLAIESPSGSRVTKRILKELISFLENCIINISFSQKMNQFPILSTE